MIWLPYLGAVLLVIFHPVVSVDVLIDCHPEAAATRQKCLLRKCVWRDPSGTSDGSPRCVFPVEAGYILEKIISSTSYENVTVCMLAKLKRAKRPPVFYHGTNTAYVFVNLCPCVPDISGCGCGATKAVVKIVPDSEDITSYNCSFDCQLLDFYKNGLSPYPSLPARITGTHEAGRAFYFGIQRTSSGTMLVDTQSLPGLTVEPGFVQFSTRVPSRNVYGLGEVTRSNFKHSFDWHNYGIWPSSQTPFPNWKDYRNRGGFHPYYLCLEPDGNSHYFHYIADAAVNFAFQPDPDVITFRSIGIRIDIELTFPYYQLPDSLHPKPDLPNPVGCVVVPMSLMYAARPQFTSIPPFWALGYFVSRFGFKNLADVEAVYQRNLNAGVPLEGIGIDIDYLKDLVSPFEVQSGFDGLQNFSVRMNNSSRKLLLTTPTVVPAISGTRAYKLARKFGVFAVEQNGSEASGRSWNYDSRYLNFLDERAMTYWGILHTTLRAATEFKGMIYTNNEPFNFVTPICANSTINYPLYNPLPWSSLVANSICNDVIFIPRNQGAHTAETDIPEDLPLVLQDDMNQVGLGEIENPKPATPGEITLARNYSLMYNLRIKYGSLAAQAGYWSVFFNSNRTGRAMVVNGVRYADRFAGPQPQLLHTNTGLLSGFQSMEASIINLLESGLFGIFWTGSDICGFRLNTDPELCIRWHQLGAFYPFARNHNNLGNLPQDPGVFPPKDAETINSTIRVRYSFLSFFYSKLVYATNFGTPAVRPMFMEFPLDPNTHDMFDQFLWGSSLLIAPVTKRGATERSVYFPKGVWYGTDGRRYSGSQTVNIPVPLHTSDKYYFYRGGYIIPKRKPCSTTSELLLSPFTFVVALDENGFAYYDGDHFYVDDGTTQCNYTTGNLSTVQACNWMRFAMQANFSSKNEMGKFKISYLAHAGSLKLLPKTVFNAVCVMGFSASCDPKIRINGSSVKSSVSRSNVLYVHFDEDPYPFPTNSSSSVVIEFIPSC